DTRLDHRVYRLGLADLVGCERPPCADHLCKHAPRNLRRRLHVYDLPHAVRLVAFSCRRLVHDDLPACFLVSRSAASLKTARASSQNPSSQRRSVSRPCASTAYIRRVPSARSTTSRAALRTFRCCETAGRLTFIPSAISPTERAPPRSRLNTRRRVESPSASRTRSALVMTYVNYH